MTHFYTFDKFIFDPFIQLSDNNKICPDYNYLIGYLDLHDFDNKFNFNTLINSTIDEILEKYYFKLIA
jgi:hypothetical protein